MIFDHLRRHSDERERVLVKTARVAADIERADGAPERVRDRRARTGENAVRVQEMFVGVHDGRLPVDQRGADRVRAAIRFGPRHARTQRDAIGFFDEIAVAETVQDHAVAVGEQHHALRVDDLRVQRLHDRQRVGIKRLIALDEFTQREAAQRVKIRRFRRTQADFERARMSLRDDIGPADAGRRGRTMGQGMSPVDRTRGGYVARRCDAAAQHARSQPNTDITGRWTRRARQGKDGGAAPTEHCRKKPRTAPKSTQTKRKTCAAPELV